ncbi:MAG: hypothetical protein ACM3SR_06455 [Ignavibacteriales bacterium]
MLKKGSSCGFARFNADDSGFAYSFRSGFFQAPMLSESDYKKLLQHQENTPVAVMRMEDKTW